LITAEDIRFANRLLGIARALYLELTNAFADHAIAWPCPYGGQLVLDVRQAF